MRQPNGKFRYNCSIIDLYDRSAVASLNSDCINTDLAINTLKTALKKEKHPKVILHSDQGVQFTSCEFVNFCKDNNITQSMSKAGCPYDNAPMERFYNTFKSNFYNVTSFLNVEMMDELTTKYINWYNYVRPHSHNNYLTPMEARYKQVFIEQSVTKKLDQYNNLDMILSVGYRVNSKRGIAFRKWANNVLKQYIMKGYAINEKRLQALEKIIDIQSRMLADALDIEELLDS